MAGINIPLALGCIFLFGILVRDKANVLSVRPTTAVVLGAATAEVS
jgi:hypothetical protein